MDGKVVIKSLTLKNLLSYGSDGVTVELQPLNVIIGANGSGKSNLMNAIRILKTAPNDLTQTFLAGGGVSEWIWKGQVQDKIQDRAYISVVINIDNILDYDIEHALSFSSMDHRLRVKSEKIITYNTADNRPQPIYQFSGLAASLYKREVNLIDDDGQTTTSFVKQKMGQFKRNQSILSQRNDPDSYPEITDLSQVYENIRFYSDASLGTFASARKAQEVDLDQSFLFEDASNLALVLNDLQNQPVIFRKIIERLRLFYDKIENIHTRVQNGTVQVSFHEYGLNQSIPATRISDGTLRYLCLLVILCHPTPPPLICIEEPELGMHPDILPSIAELLIEASQRTQIIVTTHSELLVSALSHIPESILVCSRGENGTQIERLKSEDMKDWLEKYTLGELWLKGQIGGTRW